MDFSHPDYALQARASALQNIWSGLRKILSGDPGLSIQLLLTIPLIAAGIVLNLNAVQWVLTLVVTLLFILAGIFRSAALLQIRNDTSLTAFHASRIRCMGNALVTIAAGLSLFTYLMVFVPKIIQLL